MQRLLRTALVLLLITGLVAFWLVMASDETVALPDRTDTPPSSPGSTVLRPHQGDSDMARQTLANPAPPAAPSDLQVSPAMWRLAWRREHARVHARVHLPDSSHSGAFAIAFVKPTQHLQRTSATRHSFAENTPFCDIPVHQLTYPRQPMLFIWMKDRTWRIRFPATRLQKDTTLVPKPGHGSIHVTVRTDIGTNLKAKPRPILVRVDGKPIRYLERVDSYPVIFRGLDPGAYRLTLASSEQVVLPKLVNIVGGHVHRVAMWAQAECELEVRAPKRCAAGSLTVTHVDSATVVIPISAAEPEAMVGGQTIISLPPGQYRFTVRQGKEQASRIANVSAGVSSVILH